ncbi:MAG: phosphoglucosamine mutase [Acidimicrobiales bacterium]
MRFGTDGIRGVANSELTPELALRVGRAAARVLGGPVITVGRDPRRSGPMIEAAFVAGACSEGVSVELLGVVPTPAVAYHSQTAHRPAAMISASHNPFGDNGIKLFAPGGLKLSNEVQGRIEAVLDELLAGDTSPDVPVGAAVGTVGTHDVAADYRAHIEASVGESALSGLNVVLDCGNGAASAFAEATFAELGATVTAINVHPDGRNINDGGGSTDLAGLQAAVVERGADVGFAFDGDADRMLAVDAGGRVADGDQLLAIAAADLKGRGRLTHDTVVVTVMSNLGFRIGMRRLGIEVVDTAVGDRFVLEALDAGGFVLGGEQSGHLIFRDRATTGDGLLSAVVVADIVARAGVGLAELVDATMTRLPQVLLNVAIGAPMPDVADRIADDLARAAAELGESGRVLVRPSGTEPVVRVMVEATEVATAQRWADDLAAAVGAL